MGQLAQEMVLSVDSFKKPTVLEGDKAIGTLLVRLIQLEPGTYASRPTMGVGLLSKYRYCSEDDIHDLNNDIKYQIKTFLPQYQAVNVNTTLMSNGQLMIDITIDETLYRYETEQQPDDNKIVGLRSIM